MVDACTFVHLTDLHVEAEGSRPYGADTEGRLRIIARWVRDRDVRPAFFLITGDLTDTGSIDAYRRLRLVVDEELAPFGVPVLLAIGNHDDRRSFAEVFPEDFALGAIPGRFCYATDVAGLRVVVLDSAVMGRVEGEVGVEQLAWLDEQLADRSLPTIVAVHHPSLPRGVPRSDDYLLADRAAFAEVVSRHPVLAVMCGHSHVATSAAFAGTIHLAGPATAYLLDPTVREGARGIDAGGLVVATVRDGRLIANPVVVDGTGEAMFSGSH